MSALSAENPFSPAEGRNIVALSALPPIHQAAGGK
jgi:hypothetical protein